ETHGDVRHDAQESDEHAEDETSRAEDELAAQQEGDHGTELSSEHGHEENHPALPEAARADLAHDEAIEPYESQQFAASPGGGPASENIAEEDVILLPGETRRPRDPSAP